MARKGTTKRPGTIVARWTQADLSLLVGMTPRVVRSIALDRTFLPGQRYLWIGIEPIYADLATVEPFGAELAEELSQAVSGRLHESKVPWGHSGPHWHRELYQYVCQFAPGQVTLLPDSLNLDGEYRLQREMIMALQNCALVPLVPLHRVATTTGPIAFPWGETWASLLLRREKDVIDAVESEGEHPTR